ncbi:uncharacterized protein LOC121382023 isoform X2 [Gigantopelta aegis]|uniref:uncharacterized protein LOC121382023 isoform X2 n=1 Tax=Gigantopelta aegis TaxID=1735272 RepID=UPI001B88C3C7|nr:uncharacterized protein LOC121382023 isoform X2 [Gigantopelta aegis]
MVVSERTAYVCKMIQPGVIVIAFILCVFPSGSGAGPTSHCPPSQYFNRALLACMECSKCPINQIIRKPCLKNRDTICGPFKEFNRFHQTPEDGKLSPEYTHERKHKSRGNGSKHHKHHHHDHPAGGTVSIATPKAPEISRATVVDMTSLKTTETQWRTLALGLIGILCLVSVCLLVFVFAVYYIRVRRGAEEKLEFNSGVLRQEDTYVRIEPWLPEEYISSKGRSPTERGKTCFYPGSYNETGNYISSNRDSQHISSMVLQTFLLDNTEDEFKVVPDFEDSSLDHVNMN